MTEIHKRTWTPYFNKVLDGSKNSEIRLADFDVKEGDLLILDEWNPDTGYTGRSITKRIKRLFKVKLTDFWTKEEIEEKGVFLMEFK